MAEVIANSTTPGSPSQLTTLAAAITDVNATTTKATDITSSTISGGSGTSTTVFTSSTIPAGTWLGRLDYGYSTTRCYLAVF